MATPASRFFACRGYAMAAAGALAWAARAMQEGEADAAAARAWVQGADNGAAAEAPMAFNLCIQAVGLSSRRDELRDQFLAEPGEAMARMLRLEDVLQNEDPGVPGDDLEAELRAMRGFHLEGAPMRVGEPTC